MRCVIDTNGLLKSIPKYGRYKWLYDAWLEQKFTWIFSNEILSEYSELIERRYSINAANYVVTILLAASNHERFEPSFKWNLVESDPEDNKFVDCAVGAGADFLVTEDKHILNLTKIEQLFPPVPAINFEEFKAILQRN
jgi:putative PIN family toxin of toxin-antitoxin system